MIFIGIDPGENTGFAVWDSEDRTFREISTLKLHEAMEKVRAYRDASLYPQARSLAVVFEDARQRKWFKKETSSSEYRGKLMGAGAAKRDAKIWEEFLCSLGVPYEAHKPQAGGTKWEAEYFARITGYTGRTSEHSRDAALLVFQR